LPLPLPAPLTPSIGIFPFAARFEMARRHRDLSDSPASMECAFVELCAGSFVVVYAKARTVLAMLKN
jgi:hypothetical protein